MTQLRSQMIVPVAVKPKAKDLLQGFSLGGSVKTRELVIFTRQFATMIDAGLPLVQCLEILAAQQPNKAFQKVLRTVKSDVEQGSTFADALAKHPKIFDPLYTNLITAGEIGGILDTILNRLASYLEKADALRRKVKGALTYPTIVFCVATGATVFMLMFIIPTFAKMFSDFGGELPLPTMIVMMLSNFLRANWIRPEDLHLYEEIGYENFKIVERNTPVPVDSMVPVRVQVAF